MQGIFLGLTLSFGRNNYRNATLFLGILLILFSLNLLENVGIWTTYLAELPHLMNTTQGFIFLFGPLFYFYMKLKFDTEFRFSGFSVFHLLPFLIYEWQMLDFYSMPGYQKSYILLNATGDSSFWGYVNQSAIASHLLIYSFASYRVVWKLSKSTIAKTLVILFFSYSVFVCVYLILVNLPIFRPIHDYIISLMVTLIIYTIGFLAVKRPYFFDTLLSLRKSNKKYSKSTLDAERVLEYFGLIDDLMVRDKPYLNGDLRIRDVASKLEVSTNIISQVINEQAGLSFLEYVNRYRVLESKKLLENGEGSKYTMLGIALSSGFNNRTSFYTFFKKYTGQTPVEYKKTISTNL
ncbi:MAG: AraC family transcriptional regulator [Cyclobacteriaceae bacterium]